MRKLFLLILITCLILTGCNIMTKPSYTETQFLLDTVCTIKAGGENSKDAVALAFEKIKEIQSVADFYDEDSTVSKFNRAKKNQPVTLDSHTEEIIKTALEISHKSDGAFDITIAPVKELWNFKGENPSPPEMKLIEEKLPFVGWQKLILDTENHTLSKTEDGVKIDLGGAAKGYAADVAVETLKNAGAEWGILDLGGNIAVFGENPNRKDGNWQIGIQKPYEDSGQYSQTVSLSGGGVVVTSGVYQRYFTYEGRNYHHILNPATGLPADAEAESVSIKGESALVADCLSTACLVLDREKGEALAKSYNTEIIFEEGTVNE